MFLLFEDEFGTVNLIVGKAVYERHRHLARAEPLLLARGALERSQGVVNVIVRELAPLERFLSGGIEEREGEAVPARVHQLPMPRPRGRGLAGSWRGGGRGSRGWVEHARRGAAGAELRDGAATVNAIARPSRSIGLSP